MKIAWAPLAVQRAIEQARFIALDKPGAAAKWLDGLFDLAETLERFPERGRVVPELGNQEFRELAYGKYRLIYRVEARRVSVLTVRHGRRLLDLHELEPPP